MSLDFSRKVFGRALVTSLSVFAMVVGPQAAASPSSADGGTWSKVQPVRFAAGVAKSPLAASFNSVSCSASTCVAAGYFVDLKHHDQPMTDTSSDSGTTWSKAQPAIFAAGVQPPGSSSQFNSVSCSLSTCVAAGYFTEANGGYQAITETSSDSGTTWSKAQPANFAAGEQVQGFTTSSEFNSVSCSSSTCVAAGWFIDATDNVPAMTETSSDGGVTWSTVQPVNFAVGVQSGAPESQFLSVSCSSSTCVAAGRFSDVNGINRAMTETSSDGGVTWSTAQPAIFATGVQFGAPIHSIFVSYGGFTSVSCSSSTCVAVGAFLQVNNKLEPMTEASSDGGVTWSNARPAKFAANVQIPAPNNSTSFDTYFESVSCTSLTCVAVGRFLDVKHHHQAMTETSSNGGVTWSIARPAKFAAGVQSTAPEANFTSVSCSSWTCVASGSFVDDKRSHSDMIESSSDGGVKWSKPQQASVSGSVSCSSSTCVIAGGRFLEDKHRG